MNYKIRYVDYDTQETKSAEVQAVSTLTAELCFRTKHGWTHTILSVELLGG